MKTLLEVLQSGTDYLARQGCDEARATMQHLMAHVLHCNRTALYSRFDRPVEEAELAPLRELLKRRANTLYTNWLNYYVYQLTPYVWEDDKE